MSRVEIEVVSVEICATRNIGAASPVLVMSIEINDREMVKRAVQELLGSMTEQQVADFLFENYASIMEQP